MVTQEETTDTVKKTPNISKHKEFDDNPYPVEIDSRYVQKNPEHNAEERDGKLYGIYEIPLGRVVPDDRAVYNKLFKGNTDMLMSLPEPAMKMFYYITEHLKVNKDQICIDREEYLKFAGYKPKARLTYYRALEGLLCANIIARMKGSNGCFYINANVLYNGDRTKIQNVIIRQPTKSFTGFNRNREEV